MVLMHSVYDLEPSGTSVGVLETPVCGELDRDCVEFFIEDVAIEVVIIISCLRDVF